MEEETEFLPAPKPKNKSKIIYKTVKIKTTDNEYTLIKDLTGGNNVSTQIRDLFLNVRDFTFKSMPQLNFHLIREVMKIDNNLEQLKRAVEENENCSYVDEYDTTLKLLSKLGEMNKAILKRNIVPAGDSKGFQELLATEEEMFKERVQEGPRKNEIKIYFSDEQYEMLMEKVKDFDGYSPAYLMREYFLLVAIKLEKLIPRVDDLTIVQLNQTGIALNLTAKGVNERRKLGVSLMLDTVIVALMRVKNMFDIIYKREVGYDIRSI